MTGLLNGVFGKLVSIKASGGEWHDVVAIFREGPVQVLQDGYPVTTVLPTLSGDKRAISALQDGGLVKPGNGKTYRCGASLPSGSPASDARIVYELELINAPS